MGATRPAARVITAILMTLPLTRLRDAGFFVVAAEAAAGTATDALGAGVRGATFVAFAGFTAGAVDLAARPFDADSAARRLLRVTSSFDEGAICGVVGPDWDEFSSESGVPNRAKV